MTSQLHEPRPPLDPGDSTEQAEVLRVVLDNLAQGMAVLGPDQRVLASNRSFEELLGLLPGAVPVGADLREILSAWAKDTGVDRQVLDRLLLHLDSTAPVELELPRQGREESRWCLLNPQPLPGKVWSGRLPMSPSADARRMPFAT